MKNYRSLSVLLLCILLVLPCISQSQPGIHGGVNLSMFSDAEPPFSGTRLATAGINAGVYDILPLNDVVFMQGELNYIKLGAYNPQERVLFNTYSISVPITVGIKIGQLRSSIGGYVNRLVYAKNYNFSGVGTFGWSVKDWDYYKKWTAGVCGTISYDLIPVIVQVSGTRGLVKVQHVNYGDGKYLGYDASLAARLYIPFKVFYTD